MWFRPDRTLQQAVAGPGADLTLMPGPKDPPERKRLRSDVLDFVFNDKGKLEELTALKDTLFNTEPIPPAKTVPRTLECKRFVAKMDPATARATEGDVAARPVRREQDHPDPDRGPGGDRRGAGHRAACRDHRHADRSRR